MSSRELEAGLNSLRFARRLTLGLLAETPEEHWFHIAVPGGNHAAWIAGHLAWEDDYFLKDLVENRGNRLPQSWHDCFAQHSRPTHHSGDYPRISAIRAQLDSCREEFIAFFEASADRLAEPLPKSWQGLARDLGGLMHGVACHESLHVGQLTVIRKSLKLEPVFG